MALPEALSDLSTLFPTWSVPDLAHRAEKIVSATTAQLQALSAQVLPNVDAIDAHLESFGDRPLDEDALNLIRLVEAALDAQHEIELREDNGDVPE